jgi:tetratricopeptide (TPR) repeat protein
MKFKLATILIMGSMLVGCATNAPKQTTADIKPSEAQKIYFEGISIVSGVKPGEKCTFNAAQERDRSWKNLVRHASQCASAGQWSTVEVLAEEMAKGDINSPWSAYFHSVVADKTGDLPRAVWMVELAMKKAPGAALFYYQKGRVLWEMKDYKNAVKEMTTATDLDKNLTDAQVFLAQAYHQNLNYDKATQFYKSALASQSTNPICLKGLADVHLAQGNPAKVVELLEPVVGRTTDRDIRLRLAQGYEMTGHDQEALAQYKAVREAGKVSTASLDLNEKIRGLEAKLAALQPKPTAKAAVAPATKVEGEDVLQGRKPSSDKKTNKGGAK